MAKPAVASPLDEGVRPRQLYRWNATRADAKRNTDATDDMHAGYTAWS